MVSPTYTPLTVKQRLGKLLQIKLITFGTLPALAGVSYLFAIYGRHLDNIAGHAFKEVAISIGVIFLLMNVFYYMFEYKGNEDTIILIGYEVIMICFTMIIFAAIFALAMCNGLMWGLLS